MEMECLLCGTNWVLNISHFVLKWFMTSFVVLYYYYCREQYVNNYVYDCRYHTPRPTKLIWHLLIQMLIQDVSRL